LAVNLIGATALTRPIDGDRLFAVIILQLPRGAGHVPTANKQPIGSVHSDYNQLANENDGNPAHVKTANDQPIVVVR
jgi:hypothetical protein